MRKKTATLWVPASTHAEIKELAQRLGVSMAELTNSALRAGMEEAAKRKPRLKAVLRWKVRPRVVSGGTPKEKP